MKKRIEQIELGFLNADGALLRRCALTRTPLREDTVLRLSVEFFDDPEPCMIHRSAVMSRMYMELTEYFLAQLSDGAAVASPEDLPARLQSFLDVPGWRQIAAQRTD